MEKAIKYLWVIFLFIFPFSIRFLIYENASYRFGNFNPWVSEFVYLPEILLLVIFVLWTIYKVRSKELGVGSLKQFIKKLGIEVWLLVIFIINAFVVTLIKGDTVLAVMFLIRIMEAIAVFLLVSDEIIKPKKVITILLFSALLQIIWGFLQVILNHSVGLYFLGESKIGPDVLNVAKNSLADGAKQIRAYGSFVHPNILAGYLLIIYFLAIKHLKSGSRFFWLIIFAIGIYLTKSRATMIVGIISFIIYFSFHLIKARNIRKWIVLAIMAVLLVGNIYLFTYNDTINTNDVSFKERLALNTISQEMIQAHPLGVGVRNFTLQMEPANPRSGPDNKFLPWDFQPVHNVYFLVLNETGVQGLISLILFIAVVLVRCLKSGAIIPLLVLTMLAPFDHFLWDSFAGIMLIALVSGFFIIKEQIS